MLEFQDKNILKHAGTVTNTEMEEQAEQIYTEFNQKRKLYEAQKADDADLQELKFLEEQALKYKSKLTK